MRLDGCRGTQAFQWRHRRCVWSYKRADANVLCNCTVGSGCMGITALVMAGGKGTRMKLAEEKPLIKVCNKPVIQYVLSALKDAKKIDRVIVATTNHTPKTTNFMKELGVEVIETPGN